MSEFSDALKGMMGLKISVDPTKVLEIIEEIVAAAPAIEKGIATVEPFVQAIVTLIEHGGSPTAEDWATVQAILDANSAAIAEASKEAASEIPTGADQTQSTQTALQAAGSAASGGSEEEPK